MRVRSRASRVRRAKAVLGAAFPHVTEWGCAVDVGAHVGVWSERLAARFDRVVAFEPHPPHAARARRLKGVEVHEAALGHESGEASLRAGEVTDGQYHLGSGEGTQVLTLDGVGLTAVGLVKVDVEGYEWYVLQGGAQTIERDRPVIVIEANGLSERYGVDPDAPRTWLGDRGYRMAGRVKNDEVWVP
jgi:FkbM family methyltransferase